MEFVKPAEARRLRAFAELADCNPFVAKRVVLEKSALGADYRDLGKTWHLSLDPRVINPNMVALRERIPAFAALLRNRLSEGAQASDEQLVEYDALVRHHLYYQYDHEFAALIERSERGELSARSISSYERYTEEVRSFLEIPGVELPLRSDPAHLYITHDKDFDFAVFVNAAADPGVVAHLNERVLTRAEIFRIASRIVGELVGFFLAILRRGIVTGWFALLLALTRLRKSLANLRRYSAQQVQLLGQLDQLRATPA